MPDPSFLTPPELARRYGVAPEQVLLWIRGGELLATNLATRPDGRPRWRISADAIEAFEAARSSSPTPKTKRRRRGKAEHVTQYF